jgi:tyrosyl-tRNA synthetase
MAIKSKSQKIEEVLTKGVEQILPSKAGLKKLMERERIRLYLGIDPTASRLHLGHTIGLRKLQEFADLGCEVFLIIGTGTVLAGDPSLREEARKKITKKEVARNIKTWKRQAGKILDFSRINIRYNGDWLLRLKLEDIINIASNISAIKLFQRDSFRRRIKKGDTVWMHEVLYPLLQGYDSVHLGVDLEIGGTDQIFNILIGRELEKKMKNKEKFVLTFPMITGIDGKPMSKTSGNCVWIEDSPNEMYGKIMSIPDDLIFSYFELLTDVSLSEIAEFKKSGVNPKELKEKLAKEIVKIYHGGEAAQKAAAEFERIFKEKKAPSKIPTVKIKKNKISILDLLVEIKLAGSKTEARRLITQKGVKINGEIKNDWKAVIAVKKGMIIQVGRRKFAKLR